MRGRSARSDGAASRPLCTFSIVAIDRATGEIGVAVASKFLAVGAVVPWAQAGVGGVVTQAWANLSYGPEGLRLLAAGHAAEAVGRQLTDADEGREHRQAGIVDAQGRAAAWTGRECFAWAGHHTGDAFTCQGNILSGPAVLEAMAGTAAGSSPRPSWSSRRRAPTEDTWTGTSTCAWTTILLRSSDCASCWTCTAATQDAFRRFCSVENFEERWREDDLVDQEIITEMRRRFGPRP